MPRVTASARHQTKGTTLKSGQPCFPRLTPRRLQSFNGDCLLSAPNAVSFRGLRLRWFSSVRPCPPVPRGFRFSFRAGPLPASHAPRYVSLGTNVCVRFLRVPGRLTFALRFSPLQRKRRRRLTSFTQSWGARKVVARFGDT